MDAKEAVRTAKGYAADLFGGDGVTGLGLEEVDYDYDQRQWKITVGFFQPWNLEGDTPVRSTFLAAEPDYISRRSYKVVRIDDHDGTVLSIRDRLLKWAEE